MEVLNTQQDYEINNSQQYSLTQATNEFSSQINMQPHSVYPGQAVPVRTYSPYFTEGNNTNLEINTISNKMKNTDSNKIITIPTYNIIT